VLPAAAGPGKLKEGTFSAKTTIRTIMKKQLFTFDKSKT
jgi:hypothetical protein